MFSINRNSDYDVGCFSNLSYNENDVFGRLDEDLNNKIFYSTLSEFPVNELNANLNKTSGTVNLEIDFRIICL